MVAHPLALAVPGPGVGAVVVAGAVALQAQQVTAGELGVDHGQVPRSARPDHVEASIVDLPEGPQLLGRGHVGVRAHARRLDRRR